MESLNAQIRRSVKEKAKGDRGNRWPVNRMNALDYFRKDKDLLEVISHEIDGWEPEQDPVIYLDLAGRAYFPGIKGLEDFKLFTEQYSFSLANQVERNGISGKQFVGDIFDVEDLDNMVTYFKSNNKKINLLTFSPVGGLSRYKKVGNYSEIMDNIVSQKDLDRFFVQHFWKQFLKILEVVKVGGVVFVGADYYFHTASMFNKMTIDNPGKLETHGLKLIYSGKDADSGCGVVVLRKEK